MVQRFYVKDVVVLGIVSNVREDINGTLVEFTKNSLLAHQIILAMDALVSK